MNKLVIPAVAAFALVTGSAIAADQQRGQATQPGGQQVGQQAPQQGEHELIGMEVVGQNGEEVGEIQNVLVDEQGQVKAVIIQHGAAVLGVGGQQVAVSFDRLELPKADPSIASEEQQAKIDMTEEQLGELPEFESTHEMREDSPGMQPRQPGEYPGATGTPGTAQPGETGTPGTAPGQQRE